jgi:histidyl-tRNA synthetase
VVSSFSSLGHVYTRKWELTDGLRDYSYKSVALVSARPSAVQFSLASKRGAKAYITLYEDEPALVSCLAELPPGKPLLETNDSETVRNPA